jgi:hypothetical protein
MDLRIATSAGHPDRPNEDFAGAVPGAVVLLDGAGIPGTESICCHGVAWYTHRLGGILLGQLPRGDGRNLPAILAAAIDDITASHRGTCDITNPSSPQATVAIIRVAADRLDYLVLADCFIVLGRVSGEPLVLVLTYTASRAFQDRNVTFTLFAPEPFFRRRQQPDELIRLLLPGHLASVPRNRRAARPAAGQS